MGTGMGSAGMSITTQLFGDHRGSGVGKVVPRRQAIVISEGMIGPACSVPQDGVR
jgi:hypothetical protein